MALKKYQENAIYGNEEELIDGLIPKTINILKANKKTEAPIILLKAITGSGKTIIAANYIKTLFSSSQTQDQDIAIVWLSKGTAELHMQSCKKIKNHISDPSINIVGIKDKKDFNFNKFNNKDVLIINWEKINNKTDGELSSVLFQDIEDQNLARALKNTKKYNNIKFIVIIDEFHKNYDTESYRKIIEKIDPYLIIGMTATPTPAQLAQAKIRIEISVEDVQAEEMVKKGIIFNKEIKNVPKEYSSREEYFLKLMLNKRDELEEKYKNEGSDIVPLLLIQFDDDKKNSKNHNEKIKEIKNLLDKIYDNNKNDDYAIWISENDSKEKLRSPDSILHNMDSNNVKVLLFKQSLTEGWDCPRAQLLLRFRKVSDKNNNAFDLQTLGRIFRMPEQKYYKDNDLNFAYVYVLENEYILEKTFNESLGSSAGIFDMKEFSIKNDFKDDLLKIEDSLKGKNSFVQKENPSCSDYVNKINKLIESLKYQTITDLTQKNLLPTTYTYKGKVIDINENLLDNKEIQIKSDSGINMEIKDVFRIAEATEFLSTSLNTQYCNKSEDTKKVKEYFTKKINNFFASKIPDSGKTGKEKLEQEIIDKSLLILLNKKLILELIQELNNFQKQKLEKTKENTGDFLFEKNIKLKKEDCEVSDKNIYGIKSSKMSNPEKIFVDYLEKTNKIKFWYKNKDRDDKAFCVVFKDKAKLGGTSISQWQLTYPDFIVGFKDGSVGIYEIKDFEDTASPDKSLINNLKDTALKTKIKELNEFKEITFKGNLIYVNQKTGCLVDLLGNNIDL